MTSFEDRWITNLEDEPCDGCGVKPSRHLGHGSYICKECYDKSWCPKCQFQLSDNHRCPTKKERKAYEKDIREWFAEIGLDYDEELK
jgi:hypothetical protein